MFLLQYAHFYERNSQLNGLFDLVKWAKLVAAAEAAKDK
jgi:hypothetical protein